MRRVLSRLRRTKNSTKSQNKTRKVLLNEAVNISKGTLFVAIPKTGTTSIRTQLSQEGQYLIPHPHLNIQQIRDAFYTFFLLGRLGKNDSFPSPGCGLDEDIRSESKELFERLFKFAAVRNPWARAVSLWQRREGIKTKDSMTFEEFIDNHHYASDTCIHPTLHKNQIDWICDESGNIAIDYVYKVEDFTTAIQEIRQITNGKVSLDYRASNANPNSKSRAYRELYTSKMEKIVGERFERDIDYFKYSF